MEVSINMIKEDPERVAALQKVAEQMEIDGIFNEDVNLGETEGFDNCIPVTKDHDYYNKGFKNFFKGSFYSIALRYFGGKINKYLDTKIINKENMKDIKAAIVTCNHVSLFDTFAVRKTVGHKMKFVGRETNNWKGVMGDLARYNGMLPLSSNFSAIKNFDKAISHFLKKGKKILIYPEQAMWRNYEKPRPLKDGAFHYAVKNNVPILPLFITFRYTGQKDDYNGAEIIHYTVNVLKPIYPKAELNSKENVEFMRKENYREWVECYEDFYKKKMQYTTKDKSKIKI